MSSANTDRSGTLSLDNLNASRHFSVSAKHGTKLTSIGDTLYQRLQPTGLFCYSNSKRVNWVNNQLLNGLKLNSKPSKAPN